MVTAATTTGSLKRLLLVLLATVAAMIGAVLSPGVGTVHADKSFTFRSWITEAVVAPDASMHVTERLTYQFLGGPFEFGIRSFARNNDQIDDFSVSDAEGPLAVIPPGESESGNWEWKLRSATSNTIETYTLRYRVERAVRVGSDVADLYWQFVGPDHPTINSVDITVTLPGSIPPADNATTGDGDTNVLRGFAHGPANGTVEVGTSRVHAAVASVGKGTFVEVRTVAPASAFSVTTTKAPLLNDILRDERNVGVREARHLGWILSPILAVVGLFGTAALWLVGGRERKSKEVLGDYWREPLDIPPAIAAKLVTRGRGSKGTIVSATIVDLAQRGYLTITGTRVERFGPDTTEFTYAKTVKAPGAELTKWERNLYRMIFRDTDQVTSTELTAWATQHPKDANKRLDKVLEGVTGDYRARGYEQKMSGRMVAGLSTLFVVGVVGGVLVVARWHNPIGVAVIALAVVLLGVGFQLLRNRTPAGAEAAAKADGLRAFLHDFSQLADAPVGHLVLWERYLVYSVALGVSAELVKGLATRFPEVANDPTFGVWYHGPIGGFSGLDSMVTSSSAFASASQPNSSGGGGGFSGGGGGGGGGGGAGAR